MDTVRQLFIALGFTPRRISRAYRLGGRRGAGLFTIVSIVAWASRIAPASVNATPTIPPLVWREPKPIAGASPDLKTYFLLAIATYFEG
jgi:hypothetical protein